MRYLLLIKVIKEINKIKKRDPELYRLILKQLELFSSNANHPSLRKHKLIGKLKNYWSISIDRGFRMIYVVEGDMAVFVKVGTHDEVYEEN